MRKAMTMAAASPPAAQARSGHDSGLAAPAPSGLAAARGRLPPVLSRWPLSWALPLHLVAGFYGEITLGSAFAPRDWHVHEMLYGYCRR